MHEVEAKGEGQSSELGVGTVALDDSSSRRYIGKRTENTTEVGHDPCSPVGLPKDAWWLCCLAFKNKSDAIERELVGRGLTLRLQSVPKD